MAAQVRAKKAKGLSNVLINVLQSQDRRNLLMRKHFKRCFSPISHRCLCESKGKRNKRVKFLRKVLLREHLLCREQEMVLKPPCVAQINPLHQKIHAFY